MTEPTPPKWAYSTNEEEYHGSFDTKDEAIDEALGESDDDIDTVWVAPIEPYFADLSDITDRIVEGICEDAYEKCGEFAEGFLESVETKSLDNDIRVCIERWLKAHSEWPAKTFWSVGITETIDVAAWKAIHHKELKT